jgi:hypothetical protein
VEWLDRSWQVCLWHILSWLLPHGLNDHSSATSADIFQVSTCALTLENSLHMLILEDDMKSQAFALLILHSLAIAQPIAGFHSQ